jgi:TatD DNase family protein
VSGLDLFDTHAHLHFPDFIEDLDAVLERARAVGVRRMISVGTNGETSRQAIALAEREPDVWATVGVHPHDAAGADEDALAEIARLASTARVVAVGEIGLDFFRDLSPRETQARVFRRLLGIARGAGKPVVVHCRDAHAQVLAVLTEERVQEVGGVMHCFSGDVDVARRCLDLGLLLSLAGPVTYKNARALPDIARFAPADRLVVETDCPYLPPDGHRGRRNEPALIAVTAAHVARLRGEPVERLAARTTENARTLFGVE